MIEIFSADSNKSNKSDNSDNSFSAYKTVRFCALADHNIILSVETRGDGSEEKICQDINACKNKRKCRYLSKI